MNKLTILTIIYITGVIIGALFLDVWGAETTFIKTMSIFVWTIIFLITDRKSKPPRVSGRCFLRVARPSLGASARLP